jgi:hypothetical protein
MTTESGRFTETVVTENYDRQCIDEALNQHSKVLRRAVSAQDLCRTGFTVGGTVVGVLAGLPGTPGLASITGLTGASLGTLVGSLACEHISGLDEAVKPPDVSHCDPSVWRYTLQH